MNAPGILLPEETTELFAEARRLSLGAHGPELTVYHPGMFVVDGVRGKYPAVSITGSKCALMCEHCRGFLLASMPETTTPRDLTDFGLRAWERGDKGMLVTGGCDEHGRLPWREFLPALAELKSRVGLRLSVHPGMLDRRTAELLVQAGIDQALVDVIGDDETAREVYHLPGRRPIMDTLEAAAEAGLEVIPHVIYGLRFGRESGEREALDIIARYAGVNVRQYAVVTLMAHKSTGMAHVTPPEPLAVARFIAEARLQLPALRASLGCARPRGLYSRTLERAALAAGVNALALAAPETENHARALGLSIRRRPTCCSIHSIGDE